MMLKLSCVLNLLQAFVLATVPVDTVIREHVDILEVQHFYDAEGRLVFDQLVAWDNTDPETVVFWRMIKQPSDLPYRDWSHGGYATTFPDGDHVRTVHAPSFRERWEQWDVELANREVLDKDKRRGLRSHK